MKKIKKPILVLSAATMFSLVVIPSTNTFAATASVPKKIEQTPVNSSYQVYNSQGDYTAHGVKLKSISVAFRSGGWLLEQIIKPFSKANASIIRSKSKAIADKLDEITEVSILVVASGLRSVGLPDDVAKALAKIIGAFVL